MLLPRKQDAVHKGWLLRLLTAICEQKQLNSKLGFKGGTCAAMRGFLNRFSIDLDFDLLAEKDELPVIRKHFEKVFADLELVIKDKSTKVPQYFLKYPTEEKSDRSIIKIDTLFPVPAENSYENVRLPEIDRVVKCQTLETIVANKLITLISRYERTGKLAGRDIFDVHHFLFQGYPYKEKIICEQRKTTLSTFFRQLIEIIETKVNNTLIDQDLNLLLPNTEFQAIRKILKQETITMLQSELQRISHGVQTMVAPRGIEPLLHP